MWWNYRFYFLHGPDGSTIPIDYDLVYDLLNEVDNTEDYNFEDKKIPEKKFGTNLFQVNQKKYILISVDFKKSISCDLLEIISFQLFLFFICKLALPDVSRTTWSWS